MMNQGKRLAILYLLVTVCLLGAALWDVAGFLGSDRDVRVSHGQVIITPRTSTGEKISGSTESTPSEQAPAGEENRDQPLPAETLAESGSAMPLSESPVAETAPDVRGTPPRPGAPIAPASVETSTSPALSKPPPRTPAP